MLVSFSDRAKVDAYTNSHQLPFPVLVDSDRVIYRAYGLGRAPAADIWNRQTARRYLQIIRSNGLTGLRRPSEDTRQLGGDFIIDVDGTLAYGYWSQGPADRPSVDELTAALEGLTL